MTSIAITTVGSQDFADLLPLVRAYCDFYEVNPPDAALLELFEALCRDPEREGVQLIARDSDGEPIGFATIYWTWSTAQAARVGVMNDLFVAPQARGSGLAERLVEACRERCREHRAKTLAWQTAPDNHRAQRVYDRIGGQRDQWLDYSLPV
jgi:GNAT superfamily N-acetyltransferase